MIENRICGYSCEHNKGGVCQITMCDKNVKLTTTTTADYTKYNFNLSLFETNELEKFDIYIDEIAKDFTQKMLKDKDMILAQRIIKHQQQRIEKAIEELELWKPKNKVIQLEIELLLNILRGEDK